MQDTLKKAGDFIRNSVTIKLASIGLLALILLIPAVLIESMMHEREQRRDSVVKEISQKWGISQTITGPFLTIPYKYRFKDDKGNRKFNIRFLHILPDNLNVSGTISPQIRYRGIFEAVLYNLKATIDGSFSIPIMNKTNINLDDVLWDQASFCLGISDMRGIKEDIHVLFNGKKYKAGPGLKTNDIAPAGVQCAIPLSLSNTDNKFSFSLNLNGSEQIHFIPVGETNSVKLHSSWASPSFNGAFLPVSREVSQDGFDAEWKILHLNRNYPQFWTGKQYKLNSSSFGLKLIITADIYQKSIRIVKYAIMFIVFTFCAFFFSEILNKKRVHPIQYILVGLAIMLFYLLLLAISEHLGFNPAYIVSSLAITTLITVYSMAIIRNKYFTITLLSILLILYAYLYIVLQLSDYALLMGAIGLFIVLATVMFITRKIDWYSLKIEHKP